MKALIKTKPGVTDLEIVDIPRPACPDDGVVLKIGFESTSNPNYVKAVMKPGL